MEIHTSKKGLVQLLTSLYIAAWHRTDQPEKEPKIAWARFIFQQIAEHQDEEQKHIGQLIQHLIGFVHKDGTEEMYEDVNDCITECLEVLIDNKSTADDRLEPTTE